MPTEVVVWLGLQPRRRASRPCSLAARRATVAACSAARLGFAPLPLSGGLRCAGRSGHRCAGRRLSLEEVIVFGVFGSASCASSETSGSVEGESTSSQDIEEPTRSMPLPGYARCCPPRPNNTCQGRADTPDCSENDTA